MTSDAIEGRARGSQARGSQRTPRIEDGARNALLVWGGGMLVVGLALVGVGAGSEGAAVALAGLLNTIYGIHTFGRLGPPDDPSIDEEAIARAAATSAAWTGGLTALAGIAVAVDHHIAWHNGTASFEPAVGSWAITAYGLAALGIARLVRARAALSGSARSADDRSERRDRRRRRAPSTEEGATKVEKRKRLRKSAPP